MQREAQPRRVVSFGPFDLVHGERLLLKQGVPVSLGGRAYDILAVLLERPGEVVSKSDLLARVWPDVTVDEGSLRYHIAALRKALGDGRHGARYITNVPGQGYCFVAPLARELGHLDADQAPSNLPPRLPRMLGRDDTVRELAARLATNRFVTITGPPGIGKTTVALALAHDRQAEPGGAAHFIDLGSLDDQRLVGRAVAAGLGVAAELCKRIGGILPALESERRLIILDSCDPVIEAAAGLAERLFHESPTTQILATSREALRVHGEYVYRLPPLGSPPADTVLTVAEACAFPAVQLYVEHARAIGQLTELSDADANLVAAICRELDGIPLTIEHAAAHNDTYGLQGTVRCVMDAHIDLSCRGRRTAVARHQTMRAAIDWSYRLLDEQERTVLDRVSIFAGDLTLEAAQSVVGDDRLPDSRVAGIIANLVAKSLIEARPTEACFRLLATTPAYGRERLRERGEMELIGSRHAAYQARSAGGQLPTRRRRPRLPNG